MTNEINKTGRMYVVWPQDPEIRSQQEGIDKMIESIERSSGTYGCCKGVISEGARNVASEQADYKAEEVPERDAQGHWRGTQIIDDERNQAKEKFRQEYGQRAVYEIRVRQVGTVDAEGKFTEIERKTKGRRK